MLCSTFMSYILINSKKGKKVDKTKLKSRKETQVKKNGEETYKQDRVSGTKK